MRPDLVDLCGYPTGRSDKQNVRLHANESAWDPLLDYGWQLNHYPPKYPVELIKQLSQRYKVSSDQLILTRGSDDGIDILSRLFLIPSQDSIITCPPTFVMYSIYARIQGAGIIECPLKTNDFSLDESAIATAVEVKTSKLLYLCRPNNPTGNTIHLDRVATICHQAKNKVMVVVDEAYIEFSKQESATRLLDQFDNLIVLRTLSKAYGLAGLRLGVVIANNEVINRIEAILPPFPYSTPVLELARESFEQCQNFTAKIELVCQQREWLSQALSQLSLIKKIWPSDANFVLIQVDNSQLVVDYLAEQRMLVKAISPTLIRLSIGTEEHNQNLFNALARYR
jgi:histidinol-phosphate aminotransferase